MLLLLSVVAGRAEEATSEQASHINLLTPTHLPKGATSPCQGSTGTLPDVLEGEEPTGTAPDYVEEKPESQTTPQREPAHSKPPHQPKPGPHKPEPQPKPRPPKQQPQPIPLPQPTPADALTHAVHVLETRAGSWEPGVPVQECHARWLALSVQDRQDRNSLTMGALKLLEGMLPAAGRLRHAREWTAVEVSITRTHTHTHTHTHIHTHACMHTHIHTCMHTHTH